MLFTPFRVFIALLAGLATLGWQERSFPAMLQAQMSQPGQRELASGARVRLPEEKTFAAMLAQASLDRAGLPVRYDCSYRPIPFPKGDVPSHLGGAADEIIRAYRAVGVDLQEEVYLDMLRTFGAYPRSAKKSEPDTNIDHRQVPNLQVFFKRHGVNLPISYAPNDYEPGDIITCRLPNGDPHIAMVVPAPGSGRPWILHNAGYGPRLEDRLFDFLLTGHFRYHPRA